MTTHQRTASSTASRVAVRSLVAGVLYAASLAVLQGCSSGQYIGPVERMIGGDGVLDTIEQRISDQQRDQTGEERWALQTGSQYQYGNDIESLRTRAYTRRARAKQARLLVEKGPITLSACMAFALEFNDTLEAARATLKAEAGSALVARSRFLPKLAYTMAHDSTHDYTTGSDSAFRNSLTLSQTIAEFGRENSTDVALRASARDALFAYEDSVRFVLSRARTKFFTILLRQRQIAERRKLLAEFQGRYDKMSKLGKARRVLELDVLTARLNVLNEEARINSLEGEELRQKIDLLHLMGFPIRMTDVGLKGTREVFDMELEKAVAIGLARSTAIAQARANAAEQLRVVREVNRRHGTSISASAGFKGDTGAAGVELNSDDGLYSLGVFAEQNLQETVEYWSTDAWLNAPTSGWAAGVSVAVPLFDGFEKRGERMKQRANLLGSLYALRDSIDKVEAEIRKSFQTVRERRKELEILEETVKISKERLDVQEKLKDRGRISDNALETFRNRFFSDQDSYFRKQISLMEAQESLRYS
ncbi:MAG: TolC family protein, partial [Planctomycetota bacterium]